MFRKALALQLVAVGSVLLLALGCQPAQPVATPKAAEKAVVAATKPAEKPVRGGTLRVIWSSDPDTFDPHATTGGTLTYMLYESLFWQDPDLNITKEGLAKDWTISADGKSITLKLREGVKFHDGTDFDAAAAKFNIERIKDPATKSLYRSDYAKVDSVEVVDGLTVRLNLRAPNPVLLSAVAGKGSRMVSPAAVKKYGQDFGRNPVATGPFRFVEWVSGDHITIKRFEGYWKKDKDGVQLPYLDGVVFPIIPDHTVAFNNLRTGLLDFIGGSASGLTAEELALLKGDPNLTYTVRRWSVVTGIHLNTKRPPFDNKALRQAVALAVDRQGMAARWGEGGSAQASVLHPMTWAYDEKVGQFPARDLAKAKAKLAEAGYAGGGLKLKMATGTTAEDQMGSQILKANLAEIGIEAEIEVLAGAALNTKVRLEQTYQITPPRSQGLGLADPGYIFGLSFHSQGTRNYFGPYGNPQVDQLLDKAGSIYDQRERTALYREVAKILADDVPFLPIYVINYINGMSKKVRNYVPYADNNPRPHEMWLAQ